MKWLTVAGILLYLSGNTEASALKCTPESQEPWCATEYRDILPFQSLEVRVKDTESADTQCLAGSEWESSCHKCHCTESGSAVCSLQYSCDDEAIGEPIRCKPHTTFRRDCSTCTCLENGLVLCTLADCMPLERRISNHEKREATNAASKHNQSRSISKRSVCKSNQEFKVDCNPCKCAANGLSYTCTHNECLEEDNTNKEVEVFMESEGTDHVERHSVCKPRDTFYIGCNTCHCNLYGSDYSCTNKPCPLPADVELFHELKESRTISSKKTKEVVCVANRMFIRDCNTCWCNEDGTSYFCTRKICTPDSTDETVTEVPDFEVKLRVVMQECRPNEVFELECNMCRCNPDGKSFSCTRRACADVDEKNSNLTRKIRGAQESAKMCQPRQEFRLDCNKCLCDDEGQDFSCTRIDCSDLNKNRDIGVDGTRSKRETTEHRTEQCVPGSVFDRDCNVCRCTADGLHATCTVKKCKQEIENDTEVTPSFRCTPGEQFRRDCNDCTCAAEGMSVFCTVRLCDQVLNEV